MGTIVCAVDDSPEAGQAIRTAAALSRDSGLRLVLVHVEGGERVRAARGRHGQELLNRLAADYRLDGAADRRLEVGDRASEVARVAAEEAASVIVVGSRSRHWWRRGTIRGLADDLNETAPCPVMVAPRPARG